MRGTPILQPKPPPTAIEIKQEKMDVANAGEGSDNADANGTTTHFIAIFQILFR